MCFHLCFCDLFFPVLFQSLDEVSKSDIGRKIKEGVEEAAKTAKQSAESVTKGGEKLGKTAAFKAISQVLQLFLRCFSISHASLGPSAADTAC